jgi:hypothetical protein
MKETIKTNLTKNGVPIASSVEKQLTKITGIPTSQIQVRGENTSDHYYYAFVKLKDQSVELPVIFKFDQVELTGYYSISEKELRRSFTAISYQLLNKEENIFTQYA